MLKVILVDDEEIIRRGILRSVNWGDMGFEVVGEAEDGEQAIELVESVKPDVVITDVEMPFINGLEFIEKIKPEHPDIYIIIISGYDEFHYAQKAIKLGAYDYILKPIELDYLYDLLKKIKSDYDVKHKKRNEISTLKDEISQNMPLLREKVLKDILCGKVDIEKVKMTLPEFYMDGVANYFAVAVVQIDDYSIITQGMNDIQVKELETEFAQLIRHTFDEDADIKVFENNAYESVVCIFDSCKDRMKEKIRDSIRSIRDKFMSIEQYSVTIAVGDIHNSFEELSKSYKEALEALNYKFITGEGQDIYFEDLKPGQKNEFYSLDYNDLELTVLIKFGDKDLIRKKLEDLIEQIRTTGSSSYLYMQIVVGSIYMQSLRVLKESGGSAEEVFINPIEIYNKIMSHQTIDGMIKELSKVIFKIADYITTKQSGKFSLVLEKAKEYIKNNYTNSDLSLDEVANKSNISTCYFSVIFKQEVGETFIDYLTKFRIEKAKKLLALSDYKAYEISYKVGYSNPTYFSTIFKRYVGLSPTEYRNRYKDKSNPDT